MSKNPANLTRPAALRIGVVMDPIESVKYKKDTTLALLWAASDRGWQLFYMRQEDLSIRDGEPVGMACPLQVYRDPAAWFSFEASPEERKLTDFDVILMRKDPPFDMNYIYSTYVLEAARDAGVLVVNDPSSLRDCNEKVFATRFPQCCPPTLVSSNAQQLSAFAARHGDIVLKPLDGMGGEGVFRVLRDDPNLSVAIEVLSQRGRRPIMAQAFIPEIVQGDKRILMVDGEPIPYCLARIPRAGEARGNLAAGGVGRVQPLSDRDRWIASEVGPELRRRGLLFVGLDVIGSYLTEINVTSPTCLREIEEAQACGIADKLMDVISQKSGDR